MTQSRAQKLLQARRRFLRIRRLYGPPAGELPSVSTLRARRLAHEKQVHSAHIRLRDPKNIEPLDEMS